jgi:hypothetical protein
MSYFQFVHSSLFYAQHNNVRRGDLMNSKMRSFISYLVRLALLALSTVSILGCSSKKDKRTIGEKELPKIEIPASEQMASDELEEVVSPESEPELENVLAAEATEIPKEKEASAPTWRLRLPLEIVDYTSLLGMTQPDLLVDIRELEARYREHVYLKNPTYSPEPTCTDLFNVVDQQKFKSVDQFLSHLSRLPRYQPYFENYMFAFKSRSLQQPTSHRQPRAFLYGRSGRMVMTYLGGLDKNGRDAVEVMCFNEHSKTFRFVELDFQRQLPNFNKTKGSDAICLTCHGVKDPRPNFDPYHVWPGFYGSLARDGCSTVDKDSLEYKYVVDFLSGPREQGRYKHLLPEIKSEDLPPGCPSDDNPYEYTVRNAVHAAPTEDYLDKATLTNRLRVQRLLSESPHFKDFQYVLAALSIGCSDAYSSDILGYFPPMMREFVFPYYKMNDFVQKVIESEYQQRRGNFLEFNADSRNESRRTFTRLITPLTDDVSVTTSFFYLAELMGVDYRNWGMGVEVGMFDFSSGNNNQSMEIYSIIGGTLSWETAALSCRSLREKSQKALSQYLPPEKPSFSMRTSSALKKVVDGANFDFLVTDQQAILSEFKKCMDCHDGNARYFGFYDKESIKKELNSDPLLLGEIEKRILGLTDKAIMPKKRFLSDEMRVKMVLYLRHLFSDHSEKGEEGE